jgi:predicted PurR-regulated permease PerM
LSTQHSILDRFFKLSVGLVCIALLFWMVLLVGKFLIHIVVLCGLTLMFTYLLLAPVNLMDQLFHRIIQGTLRLVKLPRLENKIPTLLPRGLAILLVYLLFGLSTLVFSVRLLPVAADQLVEFSGDFPKYVQQGEEWLLNTKFTQDYFHQEVEMLLSQGAVSLPSKDVAQIKASENTQKTVKLSPAEKQVIREKVFLTSHQRIEQMVREQIGTYFSNLLKVISTTLAGFVYALTGLVLIFYLLLDGIHLKESFIQMLPVENQPTANAFLSAMHNVMFGYTKGHLILGAVTGVYLIILNSVLGIPYAFFLGSFFAIAQIVPVVGPWVGFLPWLLVIHSVSTSQFVLVVLGILFFQLIKDVWVAPKILGHVMGLHPVIVILSLLICAQVAGLAGILFAIPLASMLNVLIRFSLEKESSKRINV